MENYVKPIVEVSSETAEGVYAASGNTAPGCDSKYMKGVWQGQIFEQWPTTVIRYYGCTGCPANTGYSCAIAAGEHFDESGNAGSYSVDSGNRMPTWEKQGATPDQEISKNEDLKY